MIRRPEPRPTLPKPRRLPERKAVTIIAGFRCLDGVVLCGDTQETDGIHKTKVTKLVTSPPGQDISEIVLDGTFAASFCGAGEGPFIDMIIRKAWKSTEYAVDLDQACDFIECNIKSTYKEYGEIYQPGECPVASLIYGVKMNGESRLFSAEGPVVNPVETYTSSGVGRFMAEFLAGRMYSRVLTVHQCAILAAYILFQAKEHVESCGGESDIAVLRNNAEGGLLPRHRVDGITKILERADKRLGDVLLASGNLSPEYDMIVETALENIGDHINTVRSSVLKNVKQTEDMLWFLGGAPMIEVPEEFSISVPVFYGEPVTTIKVRLRFRIAQGKLSFHYKLYRPSETQAQAFEAAVMAMRVSFDAAVLMGNPS